MKLESPACARNRAPILAQLGRLLPRRPEPTHVLEVSSGTGEHAAYFAAHLPHVTWQPTDCDPRYLASIAAHAHDAALPNLRPPLTLDVHTHPWPRAGVQYDAIFNANMLHIAPWSAARALFAGASHALHPHGTLVTYGPYRIGGAHTSDSNASFDADLRARDPAWGVRDLEALEAEAARHALTLAERIPMPSNNFLLRWGRG